MLNKEIKEGSLWLKKGWGEAGTLLPGSESGLSLFSLCYVQEAGSFLCDRPAAQLPQKLAM